LRGDFGGAFDGQRRQRHGDLEHVAILEHGFTGAGGVVRQV
jgi:hypothetical protein